MQIIYLYIDSLKVKEFYMYGVQRIGYLEDRVYLGRKCQTPVCSTLSLNVGNGNMSTAKTLPGISIPVLLPGTSTVTPLHFGNKRYELNDWLGNVRVVINDRKTPVNTGTVTISYKPQVVSVSDYYSFGSEIAERSYEPIKPSYRFGFNTQEKTFEINRDHYTAKYWEYDSRLGRRWNVDPKPTVGESEYAVNKNNPIQNNDPDGDCPWCVGAIVSAALDAGLQITEIVLDDNKSLKDFSFTSVAVSAAAGAIGVGIAAKIDKAIKVANLTSKVTTTTIKVTTNAAIDAATSVASQKVTKGEVNADEVLVDVVVGGLAGKFAGDVAEKLAKNSPTAKVLAKQADRDKRIAGNNPRPSRSARAKASQEKYENYIVRRGVAASTVASGLASDATKKVFERKNEEKRK